MSKMDAITIQILRNKITSLVDEMHYHFYRSGYSTIIRESRDFSCVILDRDGRLIVAPPMFFHAPVYRHLVGRILEIYAAPGAIQDGDVFVSNHPYEGGLPHVSDMAFVAPVFVDGALVAFSGSIAHKADVGGTVAGSTSADATEMFHEGVLVPPIKIWEAGRALPDVERLILANSRQPALVRGDMHAQIAVTQMGAARVKELCGRFGAATVTQAFARILKGAADELEGAIAKLPDGTASAEGFLDSDGVAVNQPVKLAVTITIRDGRAGFDFSGSDPQAKGPINLRPSMVEACVFYCLLGSLDPNLHFNDGMRDVVTLTFAPRTVTNAEPPAPVSNYQMVNLMLVDVILEALAKLNPGRAIAHSGASSALGIAWSKGRPGQSAMQQPAHHPDRDSGIRVSLPDHALRPGAGFRRRRRMARRPRHAARIRIAGERNRHPPLQQDPFSTARPRRRQARQPRALRGAARHQAGIRDQGFGPHRDEGGRALPAAERRRWRLRRSPPPRPRRACERFGRRLCVARRGNQGLRRVVSVWCSFPRPACGERATRH
jgi:N-methylhydantoinase B